MKKYCEITAEVRESDQWPIFTYFETLPGKPEFKSHDFQDLDCIQRVKQNGILNYEASINAF